MGKLLKEQILHSKCILGKAVSELAGVESIFFPIHMLFCYCVQRLSP